MSRDEAVQFVSPPVNEFRFMCLTFLLLTFKSLIDISLAWWSLLSFKLTFFFLHIHVYIVSCIFVRITPFHVCSLLFLLTPFPPPSLISPLPPSFPLLPPSLSPFLHSGQKQASPLWCSETHPFSRSARASEPGPARRVGVTLHCCQDMGGQNKPHLPQEKH